ncbi:MAG: portal protein [Cypionkella sp.]|nr:portal protein [Cypionkella sp.]
MQQFEDSFNATQEDRERALAARRFVRVRGAQWDWDEENQYGNKIKLELNHVAGAIDRIVNEFRRNRISATFMPRDGGASDVLCDAMAARYRADTYDPQGREARSTAFMSAVEGGFGGVRLYADYDHRSKEHQRVCLEPIPDAEACLFFDVNAKRKDKSDAEHAFVITAWSPRAFKAKYGEVEASWPGELRERGFQYEWFSPEVVRVAEYFVKRAKKDTFHVFTGYDDDVIEIHEDDVDAERADLLAKGYDETETRVADGHRVEKYVMTGRAIIEKQQIIPGGEIPLAPQYGHRSIINNVERFHGHAQRPMDAQIVFNMEVSKIAENAMASGVEKPIFSPEQIGAYADMWQNDHTENNAFLLVNPIKDMQGNVVQAGPLGFTKSPSVPEAVVALTQLTRDSIADLLGNQENAEGVGPQVSGVAMELAQGRIDMQSYGYMDEAADTERRIAEIWQAMASEIYVEAGRKLKTMSEDGKRGSVEIGRKILDEKTGGVIHEIDFASADMEVEVDVGPTSASRRTAIVRSVTALLPLVPDPETQSMLSHVALMNMEGEGLQPARDWSRKKLIAMGVEEPTKEEMAEAAAMQEAPQPDANLIAAQALETEAQAKVMTAQANAALSAARVQEAEAKTAQIISQIPADRAKAAVDVAAQIAKGLTNG